MRPGSAAARPSLSISDAVSVPPQGLVADYAEDDGTLEGSVSMTLNESLGSFAGMDVYILDFKHCLDAISDFRERDRIGEHAIARQDAKIAGCCLSRKGVRERCHRTLTAMEDMDWVEFRRVAGVTNAIALRLPPQLEFSEAGGFIDRSVRSERQPVPAATGMSPLVSLILTIISCPVDVAPERREVRGSEYCDNPFAEPEDHSQTVTGPKRGQRRVSVVGAGVRAQPHRDRLQPAGDVAMKLLHVALPEAGWDEAGTSRSPPAAQRSS